MRTPEPPPDFREVLARLSPARFGELTRLAFSSDREDTYEPWAKLRYKKPPQDLSPEEWWAVIKLRRMGQARATPLCDRNGQPFWLSMPERALELLHFIDQNASGNVVLSEDVGSPGNRDRYIMSSFIEEAITSSQLEGAATTRPVAKEMLRSGRPPRNKSERMILNNFLAMQQIREWRAEKLTPELVLELHRIVTDGTLANPASAGRLQRPDDERVMVWSSTNQAILHAPPPATELPNRLDAMCRFANGEDGEGRFIHPVVRAVELHFWLAYDHLFEDGNGRTARALFYWSMLAQHYWLAEFLTISSILRKAPSKYATAFMYSEQDDNDLTYFLLYHLGVIRRSILDLHDYLKRKMAEVRETESLLRAVQGLNHRQVALISHAVRHPGSTYTIASHRSSHQVVYETARSDLLELADRGLLDRRTFKREFQFRAAADLARRLQDPLDTFGTMLQITPQP